jgi:hypothetical protein
MAVGLFFVPVHAEAVQPPAKCKVLEVTTTTQHRAVYDPTRTGDQTGIRSRTVTTTTERCRGELSTSVAYGAWSAPVFSY